VGTNLRNGWSPYLAGALVGLLAIASAFVTIYFTGKTTYLGASTTFVRAAGLIEETIAPEHVKANEYFNKEKVKIEWQFYRHFSGSTFIIFNGQEL
jgi:hypothetical protein